MWEREQEAWKPADIWSSILQTVHYYNEYCKFEKPISNIIWVWINDVRLLSSNQLQVKNLKKYKNTNNLTIWNSKNQTKQANISFRQKHATVIWQLNKLRNMCERERQQKTWKPTDRFLLRPISCIIKVSVDSFGLLLIRVRWCCELMLLGYCYTNHR